MAKIKAIHQFSTYYNFDKKLLENLGVLDPTLNIDTPLYIDPLLLSKSTHSEMKEASKTYDKYFLDVAELLQYSENKKSAFDSKNTSWANRDVAWKSAEIKLLFPEVKGTCLGLGAGSVEGRGVGPEHRDIIIRTAKEIIDLGIKNSELFSVLSLFEKGIGPDRIGDMTSSVILNHILDFNERILPKLPINKLHKFNIDGREIMLPRNPFLDNEEAVILLPRDVLRNIPIAKDREGIKKVALHNFLLRKKLNEHFGKLWKKAKMEKEDKAKFKEKALSNKTAMEVIFEAINLVEKKPYDTDSDPLGTIFWRNLAEKVAKEFPFKIKREINAFQDAQNIVSEIIKQFTFLIQERRLSTELFDSSNSNKPRPEAAAQKLFYAIAYSYCVANNLDVTPEAETGNGPVDFKFSSGFSCKIIVEIKLSTNSKLIGGYFKQTEKYKNSEEALKAHYLVINVGKLGRKLESLKKRRKEMEDNGNKNLPELNYVDGLRKESASKL